MFPTRLSCKHCLWVSPWIDGKTTLDIVVALYVAHMLVIHGEHVKAMFKAATGRDF